MSTYTAEQVRSESSTYLDNRDGEYGQIIAMLEAYAADLDAREGQEPKAWLIEYERNGHSYKVAQMHNCIADYRDFDPNATSTPLYEHPAANLSGQATVPRSEYDRLMQICVNVHDRILRGDDDGELTDALQKAWSGPVDRRVRRNPTTEEPKMDVNRSHLVADINSMPEEMRSLFTPVPKHLQAEAERELAGRSEVHVNPNKKLALNAWAAKKRKSNRAKAKMAKASRKKNRA